MLKLVMISLILLSGCVTQQEMQEWAAYCKKYGCEDTSDVIINNRTGPGFLIIRR